MPEPIRVLIVDDEKPARRKIRLFLQDQPDFEVVGEAGDGLDALRLVQELKPDLVFLDIQMPGLTGFELIDALGDRFPYVIFTTAYDEHALKAFEVHAVDYLLKPFADERFKDALDEFRSRRNANRDQMLDALTSLFQPGGYLERVLIREGERVFPVRLVDVSRISAEEKYVRLHVKGKSHLYRASISGMADRLDPRKFSRAHRGEILNLDFVAELQPWSHGDYLIVLRDGSRVQLSRTYREPFLKALGA